MPPSTGYSTASRTAGGSLTDFTLIIDLSDMPDEWWAEVDTSDGTKGRVFKDDGVTELAVDWIFFDEVAKDGRARVLWDSVYSSVITNTARAYPPKAANDSVLVSATFGGHNAYDEFWKMYLSLDEDVNTLVDGYKDRTSNANHGTGVSMALPEVAGQVGTAQDFDGISDRIIISDDVSFPTGAAERTISFWFNTDSFDASFNDCLMEYSGSGGTGEQLQVFAEDNAISVGFVGHRMITPKSALSTGTFYLASIVVPSGAVNTDDVLVYLDAISQSLSDEGGSAQTLNTSAAIKSIGAKANGAFPTSCLIDDLQVHSAARSADWISEEFAATDDNLAYWFEWAWNAADEGEDEMASAILRALGTLGRQAQNHERQTDESDSGTNLTVSTIEGSVRRLLFVTVKYSAAATVNVTITLNSGAGPSWDIVLQTLALSSATEAIWIPDTPIIISSTDVIDVFAPLLASQTSAVAIYSELW